MAHFNFVISQNAKWGHAGFYIDCQRMTVPENIILQKKHCRQLCENVTSSIKQEVHNVSHRHQRGAEPWVTSTKDLVTIGRVIPEICSQTDKQTDTFIAILHAPSGDGVLTNLFNLFTNPHPESG